MQSLLSRLPGARAYRSVRLQALHYLARPHRRVPRRAIHSEAAWTAHSFGDEAVWTHELTGPEVSEIEASLASVRVPMERMRAHHAPWPLLAQRIRAWRDQISGGRGFLRVRGVPVDRWSTEMAERFFWMLGQHLGRPGAQNGDGELLGHVRDQRLDRDGEVRQYKTREAIHYHCDAADAVGLLCMRRAKSGGLSRIASSVTVFNHVLERRPDLAELLFEPMYYDSRGDGGTDAFVARPAAFDGERLRTFYHAEYMRTASRHPGVPALSRAQHELLDLYDELANDPALYLEMDLAPGDVQLISNHTVVHSRTAYADHEHLDERRHLLRLWLSLESPSGVTERILRTRAMAELVTGLTVRTLRSRRARAR